MDEVTERRTGRQSTRARLPARPLRLVVSRLGDHQLLAEVDDGLEDALRELFRRHGAAVKALAFALAPSDQEAERAAAEVFSGLWRQSGRLEDPVVDVRLALLAMDPRRSAVAAHSPRTEPGPPALRLVADLAPPDGNERRPGRRTETGRGSHERRPAG